MKTISRRSNLNLSTQKSSQQVSHVLATTQEIRKSRLHIIGANMMIAKSKDLNQTVFTPTLQDAKQIRLDFSQPSTLAKATEIKVVDGGSYDLDSPSIDTPLLKVMGRRKLNSIDQKNKISADRIADMINASSDSFDLLKDSEEDYFDAEVPLRQKVHTQNKTLKVAIINDSEEQGGGLKPAKEPSFT